MNNYYTYHIKDEADYLNEITYDKRNRIFSVRNVDRSYADGELDSKILKSMIGVLKKHDPDFFQELIN